jgi:hypothetical protein
LNLGSDTGCSGFSVSWFTSVPLGKCRGITWFRSRPLPSKSFPFHQSSHRPTPCSLGTADRRMPEWSPPWEQRSCNCSSVAGTLISQISEPEGASALSRDMSCVAAKVAKEEVKIRLYLVDIVCKLWEDETRLSQDRPRVLTSRDDDPGTFRCGRHSHLP